MSTTTNFKRIALVAVAALGLGVLSSVPSQAVINADIVTLSSTTASQTTAETYTATSATVTVKFFGNANAGLDSVTVTAALTAAPDLNGALPVLRLIETSSATVETGTGSTAGTAVPAGEGILSNVGARVSNGSSSVETSAKFAVYLATSGSRTTTTGLKAGSYSVKITPAAVGAGVLVGATAQTLVITVSTAATQSVTPSATVSKLFIQSGGTSATAPSTDSSVVVARTAGAKVGHVYFSLLNAASGSVVESVTAEISGQGSLGYANSANPVGRSILIKSTDTVTIFADGNAGTGVVSIKGSTSGVSIGSKNVTFYGTVTSLTGSAITEILAVGGNTYAAKVVAKDSASNVLAALATADGSIYAFSADSTIATVADAAVTYTTESATVTVTGVKAGTTTITFGNASTLAASTIKSSPVTVRVGSTSIASVKVAFDKTTYAPGEKALITITTLDSTNLATVPNAALAVFETGKGLKEDKTFSQNPLSATDTVLAFASATSATAGTVAGSKIYAVYMPLSGGAVKVSATLSDAATLATAIQATEVSATATVLDSGSAALAAVTALATTVASLRTLIVTLTNLVLKIQKKVKA
jgi:hypothetical protein